MNTRTLGLMVITLSTRPTRVTTEHYVRWYALLPLRHRYSFRLFVLCIRTAHMVIVLEFTYGLRIVLRHLLLMIYCYLINNDKGQTV
jgi:hypothetical protein